MEGLGCREWLGCGDRLMVGELENERLPDALRLTEEVGLAEGDDERVGGVVRDTDGDFERDGGVDGDG
jgi:hypothetical protein